MDILIFVDFFIDNKEKQGCLWVYIWGIGRSSIDKNTQIQL